MSRIRSNELGRVVGHVARGLDRLGQEPLAQVVANGRHRHAGRAPPARRSSGASPAARPPGRCSAGAIARTCCPARRPASASGSARRPRRSRPAPRSPRLPNPASRSTSSVCSPSAGAGRVDVAGRARELDRQARAGAPGRARGCSSSTTISRSRTSSESSASSRSRTGSIIASCSSLNARHSSRVRERKMSATSRQASEPGRSNCLLDQVGAPDPLAEGPPELRLQRPAGDPAIGSLVRVVAEEAAVELSRRRAPGPDPSQR